MYGFSALQPVVGRYVSIFFGVCSSCGFITICCGCSSCGMTGFSVTFGCSSTYSCGVSDVSGGGAFIVCLFKLLILFELLVFFTIINRIWLLFINI